MYWLGDGGKVLDEVAVVAREAKELSYFTGHLWLGPGRHLDCLGGIGRHPIFRDSVAEEGHLLTAKGALVGVQPEPSLPEALEEFPQVLEVNLEALSRYHNVIEVDWTAAPLQAGEDRSIKRWNVAGALQRPKGITLNSNNPSGVQNAVFSILGGLTSTCQ